MQRDIPDTTARLYTLRYAPTVVSLETGDFAADFDWNEIEQASWVRFHKTLSAGLDSPRTVLVVNAGSLTTFLQEISRWQGF